MSDNLKNDIMNIVSKSNQVNQSKKTSRTKPQKLRPPQVYIEYMTASDINEILKDYQR